MLTLAILPLHAVEYAQSRNIFNNDPSLEWLVTMQARLQWLGISVCFTGENICKQARLDVFLAEEDDKEENKKKINTEPWRQKTR